MIAALDAAIATIDQGDSMTDDDMTKVFDGFDPSSHQDEVDERWGDTDSLTESRRRISSYTEEDWRREREESDANVAAFAELLRAGIAATDSRAIDAARGHGAIIDRWFYPLSPDAHLGLASLYTTDPRFEAVYERAQAGLARYVADAIAALYDD